MAKKEKDLEEPAAAPKKDGRSERNEYLNRFFIDGNFNQRNEEEWETLGWLLRKGWVDNQIADYLGVSRFSLNSWKRKYPDFFQFLKENKSIADDAVEFSLYERATGYDFVETKVFCSEGSITTEDVVKHIPPDVQAQRYWLNNRRPDKWRDTVHNQNENKETPMFDKSKLTPAQLDLLEELLTAMSGGE